MHFFRFNKKNVNKSVDFIHIFVYTRIYGGGFMMIYRSDYVDAVRPFIDQPLVKILAGIRRCGKSTIFEMLKEELIRRGIEPNHIISRIYTAMDIPANISAREMYDELLAEMQGKGRCYLFLDEIQEVDGWEKAVNSLLENTDCDIYVTGSNSKLMAGEISTYLTGRYISIPVYTLSFREYLAFRKEMSDAERSLSQQEQLEEYIRFGGFPIVALGNYEAQSAYQIVNGIYYTVVSRDIVNRHRINRQDLFDRIVKYIIENTGKTFSASSITTFLKSEHRSISSESIYNYLRWLKEAFIIFPCPRYDLQGKSILKTQEKYYLADISLKYALLGYNRKMLDGVMENIVYLELKRRGYEVFVGKNGVKEIDFVAVRRDEKIYVQVCVQLPANSDRETANLMEIRDHYPKYIVTMNRMDIGIDNGIRIVHLEDFLLDQRL